MSALPRPAAYSIDFISALAIAGTFAQLLPPLAALAGIIWYAIQIFESKTIQQWVKTRDHRKRLRRIALAQVEAQLATEAAAAQAEAAIEKAVKVEKAAKVVADDHAALTGASNASIHPTS